MGIKYALGIGAVCFVSLAASFAYFSNQGLAPTATKPYVLQPALGRTIEIDPKRLGEHSYAVPILRAADSGCVKDVVNRYNAADPERELAFHIDQNGTGMLVWVASTLKANRVLVLPERKDLERGFVTDHNYSIPIRNDGTPEGKEVTDLVSVCLQ
ncbi:hypothetical protein HYU15_00220 [Candidatus Woesearchaeota archaeon]|nr:hypothetical protein [Candidatus Woesearchaeota archaeon]